MLRLDGKVAVITGATSGIGEATARLFHAQGALVVASGRNVTRGEQLVSALGGTAMFFPADVADESEVAALIDAAVDRFGCVDTLFNNAGAPVPGDTLAAITQEKFGEGVSLLLGSVLFGIKHVVPVMQHNGGGSIINNSSLAAHRAGQGGVVYSSAKAAVSHLTTLAAAELGAFGIRVNAISPGAVATPIFWGGSARASTMSAEENARKQAKLEGNLARAVPLGRTGTTDDIAYAALFLATDEGSFVSGHDLVVDGGRLAEFTEPTRAPMTKFRAAFDVDS